MSDEKRDEVDVPTEVIEVVPSSEIEVLPAAPAPTPPVESNFDLIGKIARTEEQHRREWANVARFQERAEIEMAKVREEAEQAAEVARSQADAEFSAWVVFSIQKLKAGLLQDMLAELVYQFDAELDRIDQERVDKIAKRAWAVAL